NRDATGKSTIMPGDVYVLNAPYNGGTHLPDVTVITPVFSESGLDEGSKFILFYVASRGHHADIGGITPGSMPPDSRAVEEEGVLIDNFKLVDPRRVLGREVRGAQCRAECRRPQGPGGGQRARRSGAAPHGRAVRPRDRACLYGPREGQRRRAGAACHRSPQRRGVRLRDGRRP